MSKPRAAISGNAAATPRNPPHERGNSSYQAPNRARSRSTSSRSIGLFAVPWRSRTESSCCGSAASRRPYPRRTARAPSDSSPPRSAWPAASLRSCSSSQLAYGSTQAWIRSSQGPSTSGTMAASKRSLPFASSVVSRQRRVPAARNRTTPQILAWPSRKIVAETGTASPRHALTGKRPPSTCGWTS